MKAPEAESQQAQTKGNLVYRYFWRIDAGKVPDAKTMARARLAATSAGSETVTGTRRAGGTRPFP